MKKIKIFQVDAFSNNLFSGYLAAVCFLDNWLPDQVMKLITIYSSPSGLKYK